MPTLTRCPWPGAMLVLALLLTGCDGDPIAVPEMGSPLPVYPLDGQIVPFGSTVLFEWIPMDGAAAYEFEIRRSEDEGSYIDRQVRTDGRALFTPPAPGSYSWRLRALDESGAAGQWCNPPRSLRVQPQGDEGSSL